MKRAKRLSFWALLTAFVAGSAGWCLYFPYEPERLLQAVPLNALFVSRHRNLAERWEDFVRNPAVRHVAAALDADPAMVRQIESDASVKRWASKYAGRDLVVAYVPALPGSGEPAWVFASWAGARAQELKFLAECRLIEGAEALPLGCGRKGWRVNIGRGAAAVLSVATAGGILLGCLSEDPAGVRTLLTRVEGRAVVLPALRGWSAPAHPAAGEAGPAAEASEPDPDAHAPDRGWTRMPGVSGGVEFRIRSCTADRLDGSVVGRAATAPASGANWASAAARDRDLREIEAALHLAPAALALVPLDAIQRGVFGRDTKPEWQAVAAAVRSNAVDQAPGFLMLGKPEYNGHIVGLGVPSALAGVKLKDPAKVPDLVAVCLDWLNAGYGWGLIAKSTEIGGHPATVIEGVNRNGYGQLQPGEQIALTVRGDWLILASNREGLTKVMAGWESGRQAGSAEWVRPLSCLTAPYYLWLDLPGSCKAAGMLLALCDLMSLAGASEVDPDVRRNLAVAKEWLDALRPLRSCRLSLQPAGRQFVLEFSLGSGQ